jgi:hypothetical protein
MASTFLSATRLFKVFSEGKFHDQGYAKWIVIREQLRSHNDTPFGRPTPSRPIGRPVVGRPQGVFDGFSKYLLLQMQPK